MDGLIGDLLDAGRIDSGTLSVDPEPAEVAAVVDRARTTFVSGGGRQAVRIDLPPSLPRLMADERRIVQVLNNLFSNASRHSPETVPPIHVGAVRDGVHVAISVSDEGRGVPPEQLPYLFREYAEVDGGDGTRGLGVRPGPGHLQGAGGGARGSHPGRERRARAGHPVHLHGPGGGRTRRRHAWVVARPVAPVPQRPRGDAHRGGGRRPPEMLRHARDALTEAGYTPAVTGDPVELAGKAAKLISVYPWVSV